MDAVRLMAGVLDRRVRGVLRLIASQSVCSVRELARQVNLSPGQLQRLVKLRMGACVSDLLAEQRLQRAVHLLSATDLSIKEIAHSVGYKHHSSFTRAFEQRFARSPKDYRRRSNNTKC